MCLERWKGTFEMSELGMGFMAILRIENTPDASEV